MKESTNLLVVNISLWLLAVTYYSSLLIAEKGMYHVALLLWILSFMVIIAEILNHRHAKSIIITLFNWYVIVAYILRAYFVYDLDNYHSYFMTNTLNEFQFDEGQGVWALSYIGLGFLAFSLGLLCFSTILGKHLMMWPARRNSLLSMAGNSNRRQNGPLVLGLWAIIVLQLYMNYFMFSHNIGVVGVFTTYELPFKLAGAMYYYRYYVYPALALYTLFVLRGSRLVMAILVAEAISAGFSSMSRSLLVLHVLPVVLYLFWDGRRTSLALVCVLGGGTAVTYHLITVSRQYVYSLSQVDPSGSLGEMIEYLTGQFSTSRASLFEIIESAISVMTVRITGLAEFMTTIFANSAIRDGYGIQYAAETYLGFDMESSGSYWLTKELFGVELNSFGGYALDVLGNIYRCSGEPWTYALMAFLTAFIISLPEAIVRAMEWRFGLHHYVGTMVLIVIFFKFIDGWFHQILAIGLGLAGGMYLMTILTRRRSLVPT